MHLIFSSGMLNRTTTSSNVQNEKTIDGTLVYR